MQAEVLDNLVDGCETGDGVALDAPSGKQLVGREPVEDFGSFVNGLPETSEQVGGGKITGNAELCGAVAFICEAVEGCDEPLPDISIEMKDEVADAVAGRVGPPPDLFQAERLYGCAKPRPVLVEELVAGEVEEEIAGGIGRYGALLQPVIVAGGEGGGAGRKVGLSRNPDAKLRPRIRIDCLQR
jgi:hypothetical protein